MSVRGVGIDIADVDRFRRLYARYGDRFALKWFGDVEIDRCRRMPDPGAALAEHFAVKEAVWKAIGPREWSAPLAWRSIVYAADSGTASLEGSAAALAGDVIVHVSVARQPRVTIATALVTTRN